MGSGNYENKNFAHNAHSVGASEYHLQWVTKYRYETLAKESHWKDCETAIRSVAEKHGIKIIELGVMEDHVHVVVTIPPEMSVSHAIGLLKGGSSYEMFRKHPNFRKRYWNGHFWGRGYFYRSVSNITDDVVRRYVREDNSQRQKRLPVAQ
jgi:putative transposase